MIATQNLAIAQRRYDRMEPVHAPVREFTESDLQEALQDQLDADPRVAQDIDSAVVEALYDIDDENSLRCKWLAGASDAEIGAHVRALMQRVALARVAN